MSGLEPTTSSETLRAFMGFIATFIYTTSHSGHGSRSYSTTSRSTHTEPDRSPPPTSPPRQDQQRRGFHNYFVTHLPSSSLHPDPRLRSGPHHKLPRSASTPHTPGPGSSPAASPPPIYPGHDLTVVRIPLRSAKHHFGAYNSRGQRHYNEDTNQAGTIDLPAFAKRAPVSLVRSRAAANHAASGEGKIADSASGDPQIFYFGVFDGHGGSECSEFLRDELHGYIEQAAVQLGLGSSLKRKPSGRDTTGKAHNDDRSGAGGGGSSSSSSSEKVALDQVEMKGPEDVAEQMNLPQTDERGAIIGEADRDEPLQTGSTEPPPAPVKADLPAAIRLERELVTEYKNTVGGYFRRFKPAHFSLTQSASSLDSTTDPAVGEDAASSPPPPPVTIESVLTYAFLRADLDFITAQAAKPDSDDPYISDFPLNKDEILGGSPHHLPPSGHGIGGPTRFKGGSTASIALISTPTPAPFWHPSSHSTLMVAHVGDTRALLCETATGLPRPLTSDHHPSSPLESRRLRRFAADSLVTDSFGEERISGLANSRSFGDMQSKRVGVSAEPELCRAEMGPAEYSFLVLASDGVSGSLSDQEIVDVVKEARTPEQGARDVVEYATEVSADGDNATCLVVRLGGWERRSEGGLGSLGTKEIRDARRKEALDPRRGRR